MVFFLNFSQSEPRGSHPGFLTYGEAVIDYLLGRNPAQMLTRILSSQTHCVKCRQNLIQINQCNELHVFSCTCMKQKQLMNESFKSFFMQKC